MAALRRVFFDVTFTRTQLGSVGITRTVRRLQENLGDLAAGDFECVPVVFHSGGFRVAPNQTRPSSSGPGEQVSHSMSARLLRRLLGSSARRRITAAMPLVAQLAAWRLYSRFTFDALARALQPVQFRSGDVVLVCDASWNYRSWVATRAAQRAGARVVVMVHDLIPVRQPEYGAPLLTRTFERWLVETARTADAIVCNSAATLEDLKAYAREQGWVLPPASHFRLGSDVAPPAGTEPVRQDLLRILEGGVPCFAAVGSIESRKNYGTLLSAFDGLWAKGQDVRLVVIGRRTAECGALADGMAAHPEKGRRFLALFDASDSELDHVYSTCRALVFPSLAEGFGLPLVEARCRGAFVIASDIPVFRELADEGVVLFARNSPEDLARRVGQLVAWNPRDRVAPMRAFTWRDSAQQLLAVSREMLGATPCRTEETGSPA